MQDTWFPGRLISKGCSVKMFWVKLAEGRSLEMGGRRWVRGKAVRISDSDPFFSRYDGDTRFSVTDELESTSTTVEEDIAGKRRKVQRRDHSVRRALTPPAPPPDLELSGPEDPIFDEEDLLEDDTADDPTGSHLSSDMLALASREVDARRMTTPDLVEIAAAIGAVGPEGERPDQAPTKAILVKWIRARQTEIHAQLPRVVDTL